MTRVTTGPAACRTAFVTSSLVSRATSAGSTGTAQARMAAWTWRRAAGTAAGPEASRTQCD